MESIGMTEHVLERYWNILNLGEDYIRCGCRKAHKSLEESGFSGLKRGREEERLHLLEQLAQEIRSCTDCRLCKERTNAVPGEGVTDPLVMIIGEGPGAQEDSSGRPFVGPAGRYLDKWMEAIGLSREKKLFIGNVIKCRPPGNRDPLPDEAAACRKYLDRQIALLRPRTILTLGRIAMQLLLDTDDGIGKVHGRQLEYRTIPLIPTYHPSGVLRNPEYRAPVWEDLKGLKRLLGDTD
jgi:uracil-DNA glycosylase